MTENNQLESQTIQVACFCVGEHAYALDIMRIKEIINPVAIAPVPGAPGFVEGVIELRGMFMGVIDLRKRFGLEPGPLTRDSKYIIVIMQGQNIGLIVDRVIEVRRVATREIAPAPAMVVGPRSRFLAGVAKWDEQTVMLVSLDQVLSHDEAALLDAADMFPDGSPDIAPGTETSTSGI